MLIIPLFLNNIFVLVTWKYWETTIILLKFNLFFNLIVLSTLAIVLFPKLSTIIELCNDINIDGETTEYVLRAIGMEDQMLRQLIMNASMSLVQELVEEKALNVFGDADAEAQEWEIFRGGKI